MLKKRLFSILVPAAGIVLAGVIVLAGCGNPSGSSGDGPFKVEFIANGGTPAPVDQTVEKNSTAVLPPVMTHFSHENFNGWFKDPACTVSFSFSTAITADTKLYAKWGYVVGDTGPAGGKIFYVKNGALYPDWKYLEVSPDELAKCRWISDIDPDQDPSEAALKFDAAVRRMGIGEGKANTIEILNMLKLTQFTGNTAAPAAQAADNYSKNGFDDWFLPSHDELSTLFHSHVITTDAPPGGKFYWSSTQVVDGNPNGRNDCAWAIRFDIEDTINEENKSSDQRTFVRPVRFFFCSHNDS